MRRQTKSRRTTSQDQTHKGRRNTLAGRSRPRYHHGESVPVQGGNSVGGSFTSTNAFMHLVNTYRRLTNVADRSRGKLAAALPKTKAAADAVDLDFRATVAMSAAFPEI
jgi:hypothetical protein